MKFTNLRYDKNHTDTLKIIQKKMLLKTLFLSSKTAESMTVIPALPYNIYIEMGNKVWYTLFVIGVAPITKNSITHLQ